jgi:uncharacterized membrane protein
LVSRQYWLIFAICLLAIILSSWLYCVSWFLLGPITGGVYFVMLRAMRDEPIDFGMMFKGFERFVPLMVVGLLESVPQIVLQILNFFFSFAQAFVQGMGAPKPRYQNSLMAADPSIAFAGGFLIIMLLIVFAFVIFGILWRITFMFAAPLIIEKNLAPIDAIKLGARAGFSNAGGLIVLFIFQALVFIGGVILICVGMFFISVPIIYASNAFAYRHVFPYIDRNLNFDPPPPSAYQSTFGQGT